MIKSDIVGEEDGEKEEGGEEVDEGVDKEDVIDIEWVDCEETEVKMKERLEGHH